jgi:hypothetical protein
LRGPEVRSSLGEAQRFAHSQEISEMPSSIATAIMPKRHGSARNEVLGRTNESEAMMLQVIEKLNKKKCTI